MLLHSFELAWENSRLTVLFSYKQYIVFVGEVVEDDIIYYCLKWWSPLFSVCALGATVGCTAGELCMTPRYREFGLSTLQLYDHQPESA